MSRREFIRHSDAWSKAVLEAELLYETALQAENDGGGAQQQQQQHSPTSLENTRGTARAASAGTAATETSSSLDGKPPAVHAAGGDAGGGSKDEVGTFLNRRVRDILRAGTEGSGEGEGRGDIDEGILGYLLRKQYAVEGCDDLHSVSISGYGVYEELGGGDVRVPGGFSRVVDALAGKVSQCCRKGRA